MKIGIQTARLPGETIDDIFASASRISFDAVEVNVGPAFELGQRLSEIMRSSERAGTPVCAICTHSIHDPLQPDPAERARRFDGLRELLRQADELDTAGVISVPARRPEIFPDLSDTDGTLMAFAIEEFRNWAQTLPDGQSSLFLEPLNRYEATFLRRVEQAAELAAAVNHPRVVALADLFHMNIEAASMSAAILGAGTRIGHVHIADSNRLQPGAGCLNLQPPFAALKRIGYEGYISIECSAFGGPALDRGVDAALGATLEYIRTQWKQADAAQSSVNGNYWRDDRCHMN